MQKKNILITKIACFLLAVVKVHCRFKDCYKYDMGLSNFSWAFMVTHTHTYTNIYTGFFFSISRYKKIAGRKNPPLSRSPCYTPHCLFFYFFFSMAIRRCVVHVLADIFINNNGFFDLCMSFSLLTFVFARLFFTFYCQIPSGKTKTHPTPWFDPAYPLFHVTTKFIYLYFFFKLLIIIIIIFLRLDLGSKLRLRRKIGRRKKLFLKNTISLATVSVYLFFLWTGDNLLGRISLYYFNASIQCTITHSSS